MRSALEFPGRNHTRWRNFQEALDMERSNGEERIG